MPVKHHVTTASIPQRLALRILELLENGEVLNARRLSDQMRLYRSGEMIERNNLFMMAAPLLFDPHFLGSTELKLAYEEIMRPNRGFLGEPDRRKYLSRVLEVARLLIVNGLGAHASRLLQSELSELRSNMGPALNQLLETHRDHPGFSAHYRLLVS